MLLSTQISTVESVITEIADLADGLPEGVDITSVVLTLPQGASVTLLWNVNAIDNGDGTFTPDWELQAT